MVNINLTTEKGEVRQDSTLKKEMLGLLVLILLIAGSYAGIMVYKNIVTGKIAAANAQYDKDFAALTNGDNVEIFDFQNRLSVARPLVGEKNQSLEALKKIEGLVLSDVYLDSFVYTQDKKEVALVAIADNYKTVANQILSFKRDEGFVAVAVGNSSVNESGKIKFDVTLSLK